MKREVINIYRKGFTLVELIIYLALFSVLLAITTSLFGDSLQVSSESNAVSSVSQDARFILSQITGNVRKASDITQPSTNGAAASTLALVVDGIPNTYYVDENYNLILASGSAYYQLTDYNSSISAFSVTRLGNPSGIETTVQIIISLQSRIKNATGYETETLQTTIAKRR